MRRVVVVEGDAEVGEVALVPGLDAADELLPATCPAFSAASMIGVPWASSAQTKWTVAAGHAAGADPDVGLDVADQVAQVQRAVGVGQGGGDEGGCGFHAPIIADAAGRGRHVRDGRSGTIGRLRYNRPR